MYVGALVYALFQSERHFDWTETVFLNLFTIPFHILGVFGLMVMAPFLLFIGLTEKICLLKNIELIKMVVFEITIVSIALGYFYFHHNFELAPYLASSFLITQMVRIRKAKNVGCAR